VSNTVNFVLNPVQALEALGITVTVEPSVGALGQPQAKATAVRDNKVVAVTLRDDESDAVDALVQSITAPEPARRTRRSR